MKLLACTLGALIASLGLTAPIETPCDLKKTQKAKWCNDCELLLEKESLNGSGNCKICSKAPGTVDVCVKVFYTCPCGKEKAKQEICCEKKMTEVPLRAVIGFKCESCNAFSMTAKKCNDEDCDKFGRDYKKACQESGFWPHGGTAPR